MGWFEGGWFDGLSGFEWIVVIQLGLVILFLWDLNKRGLKEKSDRGSRWRDHEKHLKDISDQVGYICNKMDEHEHVMSSIKDKLYGYDKDFHPRMLPD